MKKKKLFFGLLYISLVISLTGANISFQRHGVNNFTKDISDKGLAFSGDFKHAGCVKIVKQKGLWSMTEFSHISFRAKASSEAKSILVMLIGAKWKIRRDANIKLTEKWQEFSLALTPSRFTRLRNKAFDMQKVLALGFYNNSRKTIDIAVDNLKLVLKNGNAVSWQDKQKISTVKLSATDPNPHLKQAVNDRYQESPPYDIPPQRFPVKQLFRKPLIDFSNVSGWTAKMINCKGIFSLSKDQSLDGRPNVKIEVTLTDKKPEIKLLPPRPIKIDTSFDTLEMWFYGHKLGCIVGCQFGLPNGKIFTWRGSSDRNRAPGWTFFWNLLRVRLNKTLPAGTELISINLYPQGWKKSIYNMQKMKKVPLLYHIAQFQVSSFSDLMKTPLPDYATNLPPVKIPVSPEGARPTTLEPVKTGINKTKNGAELFYSGAKGKITYQYIPQTGTMKDLTVSAPGLADFKPAVGSGPAFEFNNKKYTIDNKKLTKQLLKFNVTKNMVSAVWRYAVDKNFQDILYEFSIKGKTLQIKVTSKQRNLSWWKFGYATNLSPSAKVIRVPFMRVFSPQLLINGKYFVTHFADWYKSNVSTIPNYRKSTKLPKGCARYSFFDNPVNPPSNSWAYLPKTNGIRYPLKECFYITVSDNIDEVWPNISNPPSPNKKILKNYQFRMVGPKKDFIKRSRAQMNLYVKYGITNIMWLFHYRLWFKRRMGTEAFWGDDKISIVHDSVGGDNALIKLFADMRKHGFKPGYFDGYETMMTRHPWFKREDCALMPSGNWQMRWGPLLKTKAYQKLAANQLRKRAEKFGATVLYQDGWTSKNVSAWNDYDQRSKNGGRMIDTLRDVAGIWQHCRKNVNGPVFSEGRGGDYYTAGLNDGDYSKLESDMSTKGPVANHDNLLVDFRLKKISPLCPSVSLNIGYVRFARDRKDIPESRWHDFKYYHHFLAAQFAYGTIILFEPYYSLWSKPEVDFHINLRGYYMGLSMQRRYIMEPVKDIKYFDGKKLISSSEAVIRDVYKDNRLRIRYKNGLVIYINMNWENKDWPVSIDGKNYLLLSGGWFAKQGNNFINYAIMLDGNRVDYVNTPNFVYLDGHGKKVSVNTDTAVNQYIRFKTGKKAGKTLTYKAKNIKSGLMLF